MKTKIFSFLAIISFLLIARSSEAQFISFKKRKVDTVFVSKKVKKEIPKDTTVNKIVKLDTSKFVPPPPPPPPPPTPFKDWTLANADFYGLPTNGKGVQMSMNSGFKISLSQADRRPFLDTSNIDADGTVHSKMKRLQPEIIFPPHAPVFVEDKDVKKDGTVYLNVMADLDFGSTTFGFFQAKKTDDSLQRWYLYAEGDSITFMGKHWGITLDDTTAAGWPYLEYRPIITVEQLGNGANAKPALIKNIPKTNSPPKGANSKIPMPGTAPTPKTLTIPKGGPQGSSHGPPKHG